MTTFLDALVHVVLIAAAVVRSIASAVMGIVAAAAGSRRLPADGSGGNGEGWRDNPEDAKRDKRGTNAPSSKMRAPQLAVLQQVAEHGSLTAEREGFEQAGFAKLLKQLYLQQKSREFKDLEVLRGLLFSHDFLLFRDAP